MTQIVPSPAKDTRRARVAATVVFLATGAIFASWGADPRCPGRAGALGPPLVGALAETGGLEAALGLLVLAAVAIVVLARR